MQLLRRLIPRKKFGGLENSDLLRAMHEVALVDVPEIRKCLYRVMLDCWFWIPVPEITSEMRGGEREGTAQLPVLAIKDQQGRTVTPAFTDEDALRNWDPNTPHVRIKARALFQVARQSRFAAIVINPFDPIRKMIRPGGYVMRHEFDSLADGYIPVRVTAGGVAYQLPSEKAVPISHASVRDEILSAIVEAAKGMTEIAALDVGRMAPQRAAERDVIAVTFAAPYKAEHKRRCIQDLIRSSQEKFKEGESLDLVDGSTSFGSAIIQKGERIFMR